MSDVKFWSQDQNRHVSPFAAFQKIFIAWLIVVLTVWALAVLVDQYIPAVRNPDTPRTAVEALSTWDGRWYNEIAVSGYSVEGKEIRRFAPTRPLCSGISGRFALESPADFSGIRIWPYGWPNAAKRQSACL